MLAGCLESSTLLPSPSITPTIPPTITSTPTIVWFPPTATPTLFPTPEVTPTEVFETELGSIIFADDFSSGEHWTLGASDAGSAALGINELTIAISKPDTYIVSIRNEPLLSDFYMEITASPTLCRNQDEYGVLFRWSSLGDFYRYSLACDGNIRLDRLVAGTAASPQPWFATGVVPAGAPKSTRMAVWVNGDEMRFFVDDIHQFTLHDPRLSSGLVGVFARSTGENALTVNFSDLMVHEVID